MIYWMTTLVVFVFFYFFPSESALFQLIAVVENEGLSFWDLADEVMDGKVCLGRTIALFQTLSNFINFFLHNINYKILEIRFGSLSYFLVQPSSAIFDEL